MPRVIIVGGGVSGLATARCLLREDPKLELLLLEAGSRLGGTLGSEKIDGFVLERGANGFLDNTTDALDLAKDLGLESRLLKAAPASRKRYLCRGGKLVPLPMGPLSFIRSPLLSARGKLRLLREPLQRRGEGGDESVASFGRRRMGDEATRTFLDPLVSGIFAGDVERLSLPAAFPRLSEMESRHGSLFRALLSARQERKRRARDSAPGPTPMGAPKPEGKVEPGPAPAARTELRSFPDGMEELVRALEASLGPSARRDVPVMQIVREGKRYSVHGPGGYRESAEALVLAIPAYRAASVLSGLSSELSHALEAIPYSPILVLCAGFRRTAIAHPLDGFGFLAPRDQGLRLLGSIWVSSAFPVHAPEGTASLRCMLGGARDPDAIDHSDDAMAGVVLDELKPLLGISEPPILRRIYRYAKGIPQYNLGHIRRVEAIERQLWSLPGLFLTGNAYHGVGINDCVREARRKARAVLEYLRR